MTRRVPVQRRSRERVEQILNASIELMAEGGVDALTTRSLAERTGIPIATIYRYFDNRDEIIAAYLDDELEKIEESVTTALMALERMTFRSMIEAVALAYMRYFQAHPQGVPVLFGGRMNAAVIDAQRALEARIAARLGAAVYQSGMAKQGPWFVTELVVRLFDRTFEFVFLAERSAAEQEEIVLSFVDMASTYVERFATPAGLEGISPEEFVRVLVKESGATRRD